MVSAYDAWLERGADRGQADWEAWCESPFATAAYERYLADAQTAVGGPVRLSIEDWLDSEDAERSFQQDLRDQEPDYPEPLPEEQ